MLERAPCDPLQQRGEVALPREQRKLAAIVAADVVGYSRLMGRGENGTLRTTGRHTETCVPRLIIPPVVPS